MCLTSHDVRHCRLKFPPVVPKSTRIWNFSLPGTNFETEDKSRCDWNSFRVEGFGTEDVNILPLLLQRTHITNTSNLLHYNYFTNCYERRVTSVIYDNDNYDYWRKGEFPMESFRSTIPTGRTPSDVYVHSKRPEEWKNQRYDENFIEVKPTLEIIFPGRPHLLST